MDLPRRIIDGGAGDWESSVLASASLDRPSPELRARLRRDLGLAIGVGLAATTATSKSLGAIGFKWTMLGVLLGVLGAAGASGVAARSRAQSPAQLVVAKAKPSPAGPASFREQIEPAAPVAPVQSEPTEQPLAEALASANAAQPSRPPTGGTPAVEAAPALVDGSRPIGSAQFGSPSESELATQLAAMRSVRAALAENQAGRALGELDAYEHRYPAGLLLVEAQVLRIDANAALGNQAALARLGRDFLQRHPASPYSRHVQSLLDGSKR